MTRMGLRNFTCLMPADAQHQASNHESWREEEAEEEEEEEEQPGTSYDNQFTSSMYPDRKGKATITATSGGGREDFEGADGEGSDRVNCSSGSTHMFACFRASAINLIVHPAMASMRGGPKRGVSAVQPVNSLPHTAFMEGAADGHQSGDDPTSPVVTCIGQVRMKTTKTSTSEKEIEGVTRREMLQRQNFTAPAAPVSPRPSKWKKFLGARAGTVNPSLQSSPPSETQEFQIDLNRFGSACSSISKTTPSLNGGRNHTGTFLAKSLMMLQLDCEEREEQEETSRKFTSSPTKVSYNLEVANKLTCMKSPQAAVHQGTASEEPLWKRRSGAKPLTLSLLKK